jgi:hypothetical protein
MSIERRPAKLAVTKLRMQLDSMMDKPVEPSITAGLLAPRQKKTTEETDVNNETQRVLSYMKAIREGASI